MPCLNEAETLETCINKALLFLNNNNITGEIIIADNGSIDGSQKIAINSGAKVVHVQQTGYGAALIAGINASNAQFIIMGDSDDSYDFQNLNPFLDKLREGYELVMGNRFKGGIAKDAMPPLHKYLGNPVLSLIGQTFYYKGCGDFHCGLRGFCRNTILKLKLQSTGMEFASEMIIRAALAKLKIIEVPTTLSPDGRTRAPHLRSWRDGWRHLRLMLIWSPKWIFLYPGLVFLMIGFITSSIIIYDAVKINEFTLDVNTLLYSSSIVFIGYQSIFFSIHSVYYGKIHGFLNTSSKFEKLICSLTLEKGLFLGLSLILIGITLALWALYLWSVNNFGVLNTSISMRIVIPSCFFLIMGSSTIFNIFFLHLLQYLDHNIEE